MQAIQTAQPSPPRAWAPALALVPLMAVVAIGTAAFGAFSLLPLLGILFFALVVARPEYGIALFLSTFLTTYPQALQGSGLLTINNALGGVFLILLTYKVYREQDWWFIRLPEFHLLGLIFLTFYVSGLLNAPETHFTALMGPLETQSENLRTFITRTAFTIFFINYIRNTRNTRMIYLVGVVFCVVTAFTGIASVLRGEAAYGYRASSTVIAAAANPNRLGMFSILAIDGLWYFLRWARSRLLYLAIIPVLVALSLAVFMTGSRSCLLGLAVCVISITIDERLNLSQLLSFILAGLVLTVLVLALVPQKTFDRITNLPFTQGGETGLGASSLERRGYAWEVGFDLFREHPIFGVGIGNWSLARFLKDPEHSTGAPHSSYILSAVEGGIFCLVGFLLLLWRIWRNIRFAEPYVVLPDFPVSGIGWIVKACKTDLVVFLFFAAFADLFQEIVIFWLLGLSIVVRRFVEIELMNEGALTA